MKILYLTSIHATYCIDSKDMVNGEGWCVGSSLGDLRPAAHQVAVLNLPAC